MTMKKQNRRDFLKLSSMALAGGFLGGSVALPNRNRLDINSDTLRVGLIGCGGRGSGAANQALTADPNVVLHAVADIFPDRLNSSVENLQNNHGERANVPDERRFIGFDAYQQVIDSGVDVVLLTTPPSFRPLHMAAAVDAGLHVFCEKPMAVDGPGLRSIMESVRISKEKNLAVVAGFCWRYHEPKRAFFSRILDGDVGEIRTIYNTYNTGELWYRDRQPGWNDTEYKLRNWIYYNWLSGDHIAEQAVHSLDFMAWAMGDVTPVSVVGTGGRQVRTEERFGNIFDHFALVYEYPNGAKGFHFSRQQANCENSYKAEIFGEKGFGAANVSRGIHRVEAGQTWDYNGENNNMYQTQHDELFASIRQGNPINDGEFMAKSTMLAIMGRMAAYTGKKITWEEAMNSEEVLGPDIHSMDQHLAVSDVALPGVTPFR